MQIGLQDIDPRIAEAMAERLCAPPREFLRENVHWGGVMNFSWQFHAGGLSVKRKREPNPDERQAYQIRKQRDDQMALRGLSAAFLPFLPALAVGSIFALAHAPIQTIVLYAVLIWLLGTIGGIRWATRARPRARLRQSVAPVEMRAVFPLLSLTRIERVYCDTLLLLARMETAPDAESTLQATLRQLNDLLENARQLEAKRLSLLPVLGANSIEALEAEMQELEGRLAEATDSVSRQSLEHSVQMCATRLENSRAFSLGLERLKAQEEALFHTLSSVQSALARMQLTPAPQTALAAQEIAETVTHMNQQTYAVEQAVQEVMELRVQ